ncbi:MAG TPA: pilus motility taxis protein HmpF [Crinalium sp.]
MLYLAEVQKKARVIGGGKTELKLLACQRTEQSWSAVPGEEIISAPDDANYNSGALVMVELSATKQVQRHFEAGRQLVSILQNFSRLQEKAKTQEEEIEQWKQSLTYQSQELNRREMEMEARQEQLQQMEEELSQLDQQRQDVDVAREEVNRLREDFERRNQELDGAWAHLRGEMSRFEERQAEHQGSSLDEQQAQHIQELLNRLSGAVAPTEVVREQLNASFDIISQQQGVLENYFQDVGQQRNSAQQLQDEYDHQIQDIQRCWQEWHQAQETLEQARAELKAQQIVLSTKQEYEQLLSHRLHEQDALHQQVYQLAASSDKVKIGAKVDTVALDKMSPDELKTLVQDMERDLEKMSRFVSSQEEELNLQQQTIDDLKDQIQQASEYDRLRMETELADEQESYKMLEETLVGQRRNLQEREAVLKQHQAILARRLGMATDEPQENQVDLGPVLEQLESIRHHQTQELHHLREQIQELRNSVEQAQTTVDKQSAEQESLRNELKQLEQHWQSQRATAAESWGKVNTYEAILHPVQDGIGGLRQSLEAIAQVMTQFQEASDYQLQAIAEMRQAIDTITGNQSPEYVAS